MRVTGLELAATVITVVSAVSLLAGLCIGYWRGYDDGYETGQEDTGDFLSPGTMPLTGRHHRISDSGTDTIAEDEPAWPRSWVQPRSQPGESTDPGGTLSDTQWLAAIGVDEDIITRILRVTIPQAEITGPAEVQKNGLPVP